MNQKRLEEYKTFREQQDTKLSEAKPQLLGWDKHGNLHIVPKEPRKRFIKAQLLQ